MSFETYSLILTSWLLTLIPSEIFPFSSTSFFIFSLFSTLTLLSVILKQKKIKIPSFALLFIPFIVWAFLSSIFSANPYYAFFGQSNYYKGFLQILFSFFFIVAINNIKIDRLLIIKSIILNGFLISIIYLALVVLEKTGLKIDYTPISHKNIMAEYLIFPLFLSGIFINGTTKKRKIAYLIISLVIAIAIIITLCRGVIIAVLLVIISAIILNKRNRIVLYGSAVFVIILVFISVKYLNSYIFSPEKINSIFTRLYQWKVGLGLIYKHPFLGIGADNTAGYLSFFRDQKLIQFFRNTPLVISRDIHNFIMDKMLSFGIPGFILWLLPVLYIFFIIYKKRHEIIYFYFGLSLIAYMLSLLVFTDFYPNFFLFLLLLSFSVDEKIEILPNLYFFKSKFIFFNSYTQRIKAIFFIILIFFASNSFLVSYTSMKIGESLKMQNIKKALNKVSYTLNFSDVEMKLYIMNFIFGKDINKAEQELLLLTKKYKYSKIVVLTLVNTYLKTGNFEKTLPLINRILKYDPLDYDFLYRKSVALLYLNYLDQAEKYAIKATKIKPLISEAWYTLIDIYEKKNQPIKELDAFNKVYPIMIDAKYIKKYIELLWKEQKYTELIKVGIDKLSLSYDKKSISFIYKSAEKLKISQREIFYFLHFSNQKISSKIIEKKSIKDYEGQSISTLFNNLDKKYTQLYLYKLWKELIASHSSIKFKKIQEYIKNNEHVFTFAFWFLCYNDFNAFNKHGFKRIFDDSFYINLFQYKNSLLPLFNDKFSSCKLKNGKYSSIFYYKKRKNLYLKLYGNIYNAANIYINGNLIDEEVAYYSQGYTAPFPNIRRIKALLVNKNLMPNIKNYKSLNSYDDYYSKYRTYFTSKNFEKDYITFKNGYTLFYIPDEFIKDGLNDITIQLKRYDYLKKFCSIGKFSIVSVDTIYKKAKADDIDILFFITKDQFSKKNYSIYKKLIKKARKIIQDKEILKIYKEQTKGLYIGNDFSYKKQKFHIPVSPYFNNGEDIMILKKNIFLDSEYSKRKNYLSMGMIYYDIVKILWNEKELREAEFNTPPYYEYIIDTNNIKRTNHLSIYLKNCIFLKFNIYYGFMGRTIIGKPYIWYKE